MPEKKKGGGISTVLSHEFSLMRSALSNEDDMRNNLNEIRSRDEPVYIDARKAKNDNELLAEIGYKPELKRKFSTLEVFGVSFSIMGLLPSISSILAMCLEGGTVCLVWGWFVSSFFILLIGVAMAELGSAVPTSGGLYYWTYLFSPEKIKIELSFLIGNTNTVALTAALCAVDYGIASAVLATASIGSNNSFEITNAMIFAVTVLTIITHIIGSCIASGFIARLQSFAIFANMTLILIFIISLPAGTDNRNDAEFIFGNLDNMTTWPIGWVFFLNGWMGSVWSIGAFDSCVHMSEEAKDSARSVPIGIIGSISACWILGFVIMIVIAACINPDISSVVESDLGLPMAQLIYDCLGKKWAIAIMSIIIFCQWLIGVSILTAASRQIWAFSRDNGLIFSKYIKVVSKSISVPIRAVIFGGILSIIMSTLVLIGSVAANALFSLFIAANYIAWGTPFFLRMVNGKGKFHPGPFYLGKILSPIVNWTAILFICFIVVMVMFPANKEVDKETMNYTVVITCATWILSAAYYYIYARKVYFGPRKTIGDDDVGEAINIDDILQKNDVHVSVESVST
ncbi:uncharacterized protein PRCAT00003502001 [Priceomyces carsonii]|uniref:uncharacterized protein n=1 Tax=Priceomyces carsonii TaxID=28549 RepID=UPI002ED78DF1|nr:unnamed protein product [Priceomyces carsonii]